MKRLNRKEEAVSPVIATILMVAITVVLAATLYMMVGDIGGEGVASLTASISHDEDTWFRIDSMTSPGSAPIEDVEITVRYDDNGEEQEEVDYIEDDGYWTGLSGDNEARDGSRFNVSALNEDITEDSIEEIQFRVDDYSGFETASP